MQRQIKWFLFYLIIFLPFVKSSQAQQQQDIRATVNVDMSQIPPAAQEKLKNFKRNIEEYLNKNKYHDEKIDPIDISLDFSITGVDLISNTFTAQLFIASKREVYNPFKRGDKYSVAFRFLDDRVEFYYSDNMPMVKNEARFDSFLSLLDYYAYMILGYDEDSYWPDKRANRFFQKALDICNKVTGSAKGWNETGGGSKPSRLQLVQEILDIRFDKFRRAYFEYMWTGMDSVAINKFNAYKNILDALEIISEIKKKEVRTYNIDIFFDSKAQEIAETFTDYGNSGVYDKLINFDRSHQSVYEDARKRAR